jgi:hypothetical protein
MFAFKLELPAISLINVVVVAIVPVGVNRAYAVLPCERN